MFRLLNKRVIMVMAIALFGLVCLPFLKFITIAVTILLMSSVPLFGLGISARIIMSTLFYGIIGAIFLQVALMLKVTLHFDYLYIIMLGLAVLYAISYLGKLSVRTSMMDAIGLAVAASVFLVVTLPLYGASTSKTLEYLITGEDNSSHFQMYRYVLANERYAYTNTVEKADIRPSLLSYAQGSHAAAAVLTSPFASDASRAAQLKSYALFAAFTFAGAFWLVFLVIAKPLEKISNWRIKLSVGSILAALYTLIVPLGVMLPLYTYGYYPQYLAYFFLACLFLAMIAAVPGKLSSRRVIVSQLCVVLVAFYGVFSSWYLMSPVAAIPLLVFLFVYRGQLLEQIWWLAGIASLFIGLGIYLAYIYLFTSSGASHLLTTGGVEKFSGATLLIALPALIMFVGSVRPKHWIQLGFAGSFIAVTGFATLIGLYQLKKLGHVDYYFYKVLFSVMFAGVLYYGYCTSRWVATVLAATKMPDRSILLSTTGILLLLLVAAHFSPPKYLDEFVTVKYSILEQKPDRVLDVFVDESIFARYSDVIVLSSCNPYTNFTGTIWAGSYFLPYDTYRHKLENDLLARDKELSDPQSSFLGEIAKYAETKKRPIAVDVASDCHGPNVKSYLSGSKNIEIL